MVWIISSSLFCVVSLFEVNCFHRDYVIQDFDFVNSYEFTQYKNIFRKSIMIVKINKT